VRLRELLEQVPETVSREPLEAALQKTGVLLIEFEPRGTILGVNESCALATEAAPEELLRTSVYELVTEDERTYFLSVPERLARGESVCRHDFTWLARHGAPRQVSWSFVAVERTERGGLASILGVGMDVSVHRRVEERLYETTGEITAILDAFPDLTLRLDLEGRVQSYQGGADLPFVEDPDDLPGRLLSEALPPSAHHAWGQAFHRTVNEGEVTTFDFDTEAGEARRRIEARLVPLPTGHLFVVLRDITARERERRALEALVGGTASSHREDFFDSLVRHLAAALEVPHAFLAALPTGWEQGLTVISATEGELERRLVGRDLSGRVAEVVLERETLFLTQALGELYPDDPVFAELGLEALLACPLRSSSGAPVGMLGVLDPSSLPSTERARSILEIFAARASVELERMTAEAELEQARAREVALGTRVQRTLLFGRPPEEVEGMQVAAASIASHAIDGDFFDFVEHGPRSLDVLVGDVMGKGVAAALLGAAARGQFVRVASRPRADGSPEDPAAIVSRVNAEIAPELIGVESFITLCYARIDLDRGRLTFVDAGHTKTVHYRAATGEAVFLEGPNFPLGFTEAERYESVSVPLEEGDVLLFYSDGLTEASRADGEMYGPSRLARLVRRNAALDPPSLVEGIERELRAFRNRGVFADDLTCVAVRVGPVGDVRASERLEVPRSIDSVRRVRRALRTFRVRHAPVLSRKERLDPLETAIAETALHVVRHGGATAADSRLALEFRAFGDRVEVAIEHDEGEGEGPFPPPPRFRASRRAESGGLRSPETVDYHDEGARGGRRRIRLVKNLGNHQP